MRLIAPLVGTLLVLLAPATAGAQEPPPGFQTDLRAARGGIHVECFRTDVGLTCGLYGARPMAGARCDFGGVVPIIDWKVGSGPTQGYMCVDEGFHGWERLLPGRTWRSSPFRCTPHLVVRRARVHGLLECFSSERRPGFWVRGDGAIEMIAYPRPRPRVRACGSIAFIPNSDAGVGSIRAQRVGCRTARRVARAARRHGRRPYRYTHRGFTCRGRVDPAQQLRTLVWSCVRGSAIVVFDQT